MAGWLQVTWTYGLGGCRPCSIQEELFVIADGARNSRLRIGLSLALALAFVVPLAVCRLPPVDGDLSRSLLEDEESETPVSIYLADTTVTGGILFRFDDMSGTNQVEYDGSAGSVFDGPGEVFVAPR